MSSLVTLFDGGPGRDLIRPGALSPLLTFSRAQGGQSTALGADGVTRETYAANIPRFQGAARRFFSEGQRQNLAIGNGTQNVTTIAAGHALSFRGTGSVTLSGTATGTLNGTGANDTVSLAFTPTAGTLTVTVSGSVTDLQVEVGAFASSYIPTTVAAITRSADLPTAALATLGIPPSGLSTFLWVGVLPNLGATGNQTILTIDNGSATDRWIMDSQTGVANIRAYGSAASVATSVVAVAGLTAGAIIRAGIAIDGTGRIALSVNGGAAQVVASGGPTAGLTTFRVGHISTGGNNMFGETARLRLLPFCASDAQLPGLVAGLAA